MWTNHFIWIRVRFSFNNKVCEVLFVRYWCAGCNGTCTSGVARSADWVVLIVQHVFPSFYEWANLHFFLMCGWVTFFHVDGGEGNKLRACSRQKLVQQRHCTWYALSPTRNMPIKQQQRIIDESQWTHTMGPTNQSFLFKVMVCKIGEGVEKRAAVPDNQRESISKVGVY